LTCNVNRRTLLAGMTSLAFTSTPLAAKSRKTVFERLARPVGLQLYTLGDEPKLDLDGTLAKVAAIGYRDIELPQLYGLAAKDVRSSADRHGLDLSCIHLAGAPLGQADDALTLLSPAQRIVEDLGTLGITEAVMPIMLFPDSFMQAPGKNFQEKLAASLALSGVDIWQRTAALLNEKAAALKPHGISLGYHNHNVEFAPIGKTTGWDVLARETDKNLISFEVDVGWLAAAGVDPVSFFKRHAGRCQQMHVKDIQSATKANFALAMNPTQVGSGKLDWARILPAAQKAGVRHFYVEQEPPFTMPRIDAAAQSYKYLSSLK
jgi:sugar phosphate isomerase/epimerase